MADAESPSRQVLDESLPRALKFLGALSTNLTVRSVLAARGYSDRDHDEGWELALRVSGYSRPASGISPAVINIAARDAIAEIDAWDEPNFRVIRAALERKHRPQAEFVFENLSASEGITSVAGVATLLDRLDALDSGDARKKTRKEDHAALDTLASRGITPAERKRVRSLVDTARSSESAPATVVAPAAASKSAVTEADRVELYRWFREWSETARAVIRRRDYLIVLGLAKRKEKKKED